MIEFLRNIFKILVLKLFYKTYGFVGLLINN